MKKTTYDIEAIRTPRTCCLIFFQSYRTEKFRTRDLLSQWSMKQTPVCIGGLGNIVLDEKSGSELEDKLEIVKWRENKVGKLLVLCFHLPDFHLRRK